MDRHGALGFQLVFQVHSLARLLRRPNADPRRLWTLCDEVLDTVDAVEVGDPALRAEVRHLMGQVARREAVDGAAVAARVVALAHAAVPRPRLRLLALTA